MTSKDSFVSTSWLVSRQELSEASFDIQGRDLVIGFNEQAPRSLVEDSWFSPPLNARLPAYFLPAVDLAQQQEKRPRLFVLSAINLAMKWNAASSEDQSRMLVFNKIKFDFLQHFFETFFPETFSIIEYVVAQDPLRVKDKTYLRLWKKIKRRYPEKVLELEQVFERFPLNKHGRHKKTLAIKYALAHLFVMGDLNFDGNYYLNPKGFVSIGGHQERHFNEVRDMALDVLDSKMEVLFDASVTQLDNLKIVITDPKTPPPYNGATRGNHARRRLDEVTFENQRALVYYKDRPRLQEDMEYIYDHVGKKSYEKFWKAYTSTYNDLKKRYQEAYQIIL